VLVTTQEFLSEIKKKELPTSFQAATSKWSLVDSLSIVLNCVESQSTVSEAESPIELLADSLVVIIRKVILWPAGTYLLSILELSLLLSGRIED